MPAIPLFLNLHPNLIYIKWAESNKEQFGENQISISFFIRPRQYIYVFDVRFFFETQEGMKQK